MRSQFIKSGFFLPWSKILKLLRLEVSPTEYPLIAFHKIPDTDGRGVELSIGVNLSANPFKTSLRARGWKCFFIVALPPAREAEPLERRSQSETGN